MISAFGARAERFAAGLGDMDAVITEPAQLGLAYQEAVRRRERGEAFYGMVLTDDPRVLLTWSVAHQIVTQVTDYDAARIVMDQLRDGELPLNGARADTLWQTDAGVQCVAVEFFALCDAMLVRSFAELERLRGWFARREVARPLRPIERVAVEGTVPSVTRTQPERPGVVVWAPERSAMECALALFGLAEFVGDVVCVSAGGAEPRPYGARFAGRNDPLVEQAFATAACVVCLEPADPGDALAFARQGYGVVAPFSSGAHEFAGEIVPWDAGDARILHTLASIALARPASLRVEPARPPRAPSRPPRPAFVTELPLVSVVTPTFNRREELKLMLSCLAAQTYPNIEAVIVNDAGIAVDDIVAEFPFARLITLAENVGTGPAMARGLEAIRGTYVQLLPDDDWLYADHVERLMNALLRSGGSIAHGTALLRYLRRAASGEWTTAGFNASTFRATTNYSDALVTTPVAGHQMIVRADAYAQTGFYLPEVVVGDNEIQTRQAKAFQFVFADHVTAEFRDHAGGQGREADLAASMRWVYDVVHPVPDRPVIGEMRDRAVARVAARPRGEPPFPPTLNIR